MDVLDYLDIQSGFRYQAMAMGMPGAVPSNAYSQIARYGIRGWKGMTWGLSNIPSSAIGSMSRRVLARYPSWQPVHQAGSVIAQVFGGGRGPGGAIVGFGGNRNLFQFGLGQKERTAIAEFLFKQGIGKVHSFYSGFGNFTPIGTYNVSAIQGTFGRVTRSLLAAGEEMGLGESFTTMLTGSSARLEAAASSAIGLPNAAGRGALMQQLSKAGARGLGASRFIGLTARPLLGALNAIFVAQMAFKGAQTVGHIAMGVNRQIQHLSMGIPNLEMGGDISQFQTQLAATERQRAIQAIQGSMYNARIAIGNEASMMHS
jgi:hypothetical protein